MHRIAVLTTTAALLGLPAAAQAASGVVLTSNSHAHALQVVDSSHHLHSLRYHGRVSHLRPGARVSYSGSSVARHLKVVGQGSASTSFAARVVKTSQRGVVLLVRGRKVDVTVAKASALKPGESVKVTESVDSKGHMTVEVAAVPAPKSAGKSGSSASSSGSSPSDGSGSSSSDGSGGDAGAQDVDGTITAVSASAVTIATSSGAQHFIVDDPTLTDGFSVGDVVDVSYQDLGDSSPDATNIQWVPQQVTGTASQVDDSDMTVTPSGGQAVHFTEDPSAGDFTDVAAGDLVQVSYHVQGGQVVVDNVDDQTDDANS